MSVCVCGGGVWAILWGVHTTAHSSPFFGGRNSFRPLCQGISASWVEGLNVFRKYGGNRHRTKWPRQAGMEELPRDAEVCLVPSLCSLQNRALSLSFSSRVRMASVPSLPGNFSYTTAQFITLGKSSPPYPAPQKTPWGVTVSDQTRGSGLCQPFCLSLHLVLNLRRTGPPSLCVPHASQAYTKSSSGIY